MKPKASDTERTYLLEQDVIEAAKAHLSATGACGESVDDDSLCESGGCSYCALARKVEELEKGDE